MLAGAAIVLATVLTAPYGSLAADAGTQEIYRLYNPNSGEHFYSKSSGERDMLVKAGWKSEGVGWVAPVSSGTPIYRLYNRNGGDHHYTTSAGERDLLVKAGWRSEGIAMYSDEQQRVEILRQYNPNAKCGSHNFTTSVSENNKLVGLGWRGEGVAWYAVEGPSSSSPSSPSNPPSEQSLSAEECARLVEQRSAREAVYACVADYDGDGTNEAFVVTGDRTSGASNFIAGHPEVWFVSMQGAVSYVDAIERGALNIEVFFDPAGSGYRFLSIDTSTGGPQIWSSVYTVRNGSPVKTPVNGYITEHNGQFIIARNELRVPEGGRWTMWYSITFDPSAFAFIEGSFIGETKFYMLP